MWFFKVLKVLHFYWSYLLACNSMKLGLQLTIFNNRLICRLLSQLRPRNAANSYILLFLLKRELNGYQVLLSKYPHGDINSGKYSNSLHTFLVLNILFKLDDTVAHKDEALTHNLVQTRTCIITLCRGTGPGSVFWGAQWAQQGKRCKWWKWDAPYVDRESQKSSAEMGPPSQKYSMLLLVEWT